MNTWIQSLQAELDKVDLQGVIEPQGEIEERDHVVGQANDDLKRLYGLMMRWSKASLESVVAAQFAPNRELREHYTNQATMLGKKSEVLTEIFWITIKETFDLWQKPSVGIRKGWKVVWSEPEVPPIIGILSNMLRQ
ncbi:MAG: hypothetical protein HY340_02090 [Candidatus Kerfeldbacteria bacterium]|nr:hypothetical protein [Candidatus Kerfeldbacteria bacterium]